MTSREAQRCQSAVVWADFSGCKEHWKVSIFPSFKCFYYLLPTIVAQLPCLPSLHNWPSLQCTLDSCLHHTRHHWSLLFQHMEEMKQVQFDLLRFWVHYSIHQKVGHWRRWWNPSLCQTPGWNCGKCFPCCRQMRRRRGRGRGSWTRPPESHREEEFSELTCIHLIQVHTTCS